MKITIELDDLGVDGKGEALRAVVFDQHQGNIFLLGGYQTFDVNEGFEKIDPRKYPVIYRHAKPYDDPDDMNITAYESKDIVAMWWWDGDGDLTFWIKGEPYLYKNTDLKCDYDWRRIDLSEV
jgi:hypothetical protein